MQEELSQKFEVLIEQMSQNIGQEQMEGGEDPSRFDLPLITSLKRELEMQLRMNEELGGQLRASNTNGLLLK